MAGHVSSLDPQAGLALAAWLEHTAWFATRLKYLGVLDKKAAALIAGGRLARTYLREEQRA